MDYPIDRIEELQKYALNFNNDIIAIENTTTQIENWISRGLEIDSALEPLQSQMTEWIQIMEKLIEDFKNSLLALKEVDDRIDSESSIDISELTGSYLEKWEYLSVRYKKLFENLKSDVVILNSVENDISKYQSLGVKLGEASEHIKEQVNNIDNAINISLNELQDIINTIKEHSKRILTEEELNINCLSLYTTVASDSNSFIVNMNVNPEIGWDSVADGTNILKYVNRAKIDSKSPIYNEDNGDGTYETDNQTTYKYLYYGLDRNEMFEQLIDDTIYGISYEDRHGYQYTINSFYKPIFNSENLENFKNLMSSHNIVYTGSQTTEKLYIIFSTDKITDFSNIVFRGEV